MTTKPNTLELIAQVTPMVPCATDDLGPETLVAVQIIADRFPLAEPAMTVGPYDDVPDLMSAMADAWTAEGWTVKGGTILVMMGDVWTESAVPDIAPNDGEADR